LKYFLKKVPSFLWNFPVFGHLLIKTCLMREDFLHFVWRLGRFQQQDLHTTNGQSIEIIEAGTHNTHAGPDFLNARLRIDGILWAGNVEMHLRSSEWVAHGHQQDPAYENVILHVVLDEDAHITYPSGQQIPCLNLRPYLPPGLAKKYLRLLHSENWIPCRQQLYTVPTVTRSLWLDRMLVERLESRTAALAVRLQQNQGDWETTFYQQLAWGFGLSVNADPFLMLAESLPLNILLRHQDKLPQLEALLFGQAGMLEGELTEAYPQHLQREYRFLRQKYKLQPLPATVWKYLRMRPANFPTVRIAQFATLLFRTGQLLSKMLVAQNLKEIENAFVVELSNYWRTHYRFGKKSKANGKALGRHRIHLLVSNIVAPFLFFYGQQQDNQKYKDRALQLYEELPAERNHVLEHWQELGMEVKRAADSQALLQLKKHYCDQKRCLSCALGCYILQRSPMVQEDAPLYLPQWWLDSGRDSVAASQDVQ
jgi:hypothetical protein